jgi:hypothetical protein
LIARKRRIRYQLQRLDVEQELQSRRYRNVGVQEQRLTDSTALILSTAGSIANPLEQARYALTALLSNESQGWVPWRLS